MCDCNVSLSLRYSFKSSGRENACKDGLICQVSHFYFYFFALNKSVLRRCERKRRHSREGDQINAGRCSTRLVKLDKCRSNIIARGTEEGQLIKLPTHHNKLELKRQGVSSFRLYVSSFINVLQQYILKAMFLAPIQAQRHGSLEHKTFKWNWPIFPSQLLYPDSPL